MDADEHLVVGEEAGADGMVHKPLVERGEHRCEWDFVAALVENCAQAFNLLLAVA